MVIIEQYPVAVVLCIVTMLCWGSLANTQKRVGKTWRFELFHWDYVIGVLVAAILFAFMLILGKKLSATDPPSTLLAYFFVMTLVVSLPTAIPVWTWPGGAEWLVLLVLGTAMAIALF